MTDRDTLTATADALQSVINAPDDLVERVAKAIYDAAEFQPLVWEKRIPAAKNEYRDAARAALASIAESGFVIVPKAPTDKMLDEGAVACGRYLTALKVYSAMLAAARPETST